jgi:hypothetical protein
MVNMTNDAWFGRTSGPWQHLGMYPFRAVEHRTAIVRAANTGVSAFIAPSGQVLRRLDLGSLPRRRGGGARRRRARAERLMLGDFKRDVAGLAIRVDELRGHL